MPVLGRRLICTEMNIKLRFAVVIVFVFAYWFQPSSPFLVQWLTTAKHIHAKTIYEDIFPLWSYSQFGIILVGISAPFVSLKVVLIGSSLLNLASNMLILWGTNIKWIYCSEVASGFSFAVLSIFPSYLFSAFSEVYYQQLASYTRAAGLLGTTISATAGQIIYNKEHTVYPLVWISVAAGILSSIFSAVLPPAQPKHLQTSTEKNLQEKEEGDEELVKIPDSKLFIFKAEVRKMVANYNKALVAWSCWAGLCTSIHVLILTYWQSLMYEIDSSQNWNGYVSTVAYIIASAATLIPTKIEPLLKQHSLWLLGIFPLIEGVLVLAWSLETNIYRAYLYFILYFTCYEFMNTVSSVQIALKIGKPKQFGLVFALNVLLTILFQNLLQVLFGKEVFDFTPQLQYQYLGVIMIGLGLVSLCATVYIFFVVLRCVRKKAAEAEVQSLIEH